MFQSSANIAYETQGTDPYRGYLMYLMVMMKVVKIKRMKTMC